MKTWIIRERVEDARLPAEELTRMLLLQRGIGEEEEARRFLAPRLRDLEDPFVLPDMEAAVERVEQALRRNEPILIYSDYDVDGMSSGALLYRFLVRLGGTVEVFIPERLQDGYGLSVTALARAMRGRRPELVIALDCGTTSVEEIRGLKEEGIDVVVIDHHELAAELPPAEAFVNPQRGEHGRTLATVGLVFKFCHAFLKQQGDPELFDLRQHLEYVALGTVADLVPLTGDNRILVHHGLEQLGRTKHVGLRELMRVARVRQAPKPATIGYILGPRLNASGRLTRAREGWELLTTTDPARARELAQVLDDLNRERQQLEQQAHEEAVECAEGLPEEERAGCIVVAGTGWHPGVVGIVASRLQRLYHRPAVVISIDEQGMGKGSGRSLPGCSLMDALRAAAGHLGGFGGHALAAGIEVREDRIAGLRRALNDWFVAHRPPEGYYNRLEVDLEVTPALLNRETALELSRMEPFGQANPAPVLAVAGARILREPRVFSERHLRLRARAGGVEFDAVGFGFATGEQPGGEFAVAGNWEIDAFSQEPVLRMVDWRW